jgi:hypothetical protein
MGMFMEFVLGLDGGVRKSKVCTEPRTGCEIAGDW